jgi:hypothetical protein
MNSTEEAKECHGARYGAEPNSESPLRFTDRNLLSHRWEDSGPEGFWEKKKAAELSGDEYIVVVVLLVRR